MNRLITSLLDMNRLEAGHPLTTQSEQKPEDLIGSAVRDVGPTAEARQHTIRTVVEGQLPSLWVDGDMIIRVLINLLENAIKFSGGGSEVEIGARGESGSGGILGAGPGSRNPEHRSNSASLRSSTRLAPGAASEGLGLGLTFCQMAVQAHQGSIRVESSEGEVRALL